MVAILYMCLKYYNMAAMLYMAAILYIWLQFDYLPCPSTPNFVCSFSFSLLRGSLSRARPHVYVLVLVLSCSFSLARFLLLVLVLVLTLSFSLLHASLSRSRSPSHVCSLSFSLLYTSLSRALVPTRVCTRSRSLLLVRSHSLSFSLVPSLARFSLANALTGVLVPVLSLSLVHTSLSLLWVSLARSLPRVCVLVILLFSFSLVCLLAYLNCLSRLPASVPWLTSLPHYCTHVLSVHITRNLL